MNCRVRINNMKIAPARGDMAAINAATSEVRTPLPADAGLRDHMVEAIGSELRRLLWRERLNRLLTRWRCLGRLLPFCHRHVRFDRVCNEAILMCSVMHLIEFFYTGSSVAAPCDLRA